MKIRHIVIFLILLVCLVGAVSAADDVVDGTLDVAADDAVAVDNIQEEVSEEVSTEPADTSTDDTLKAQDNNDELKVGTKTVDVNNYDEFINAMGNATRDVKNDEYVINFNPGTYNGAQSITLSAGTHQPKITINGNGQTLASKNSKVILTIDNGCNIIINNLTVNQPITSYVDMTLNNVVLSKSLTSYEGLILENSTLKVGSITNYGEMKILSNFIVGQAATIKNNGVLTFINAIARPISGTQMTHSNYGNLTFINSTINCKFSNYGILTIDDDCIFEPQFKLSNYEESTLNYNDFNKLVPYIASFAGNYTFENISLDLSLKENHGILNFINCTLTSNGEFMNYGDMFIENSKCNLRFSHKKGTVTIENSTISSITLDSDATLIISDDVDFSSNDTVINNNKGTVISTNPKILNHLLYIEGDYNWSNGKIEGRARTFNGNIILINYTLKAEQFYNAIINNNGNLTLINSTISSGGVSNYGKLSLINSTMESESKISNYGLLTVNKTTLTSISNEGIIILPIEEDKEVEDVYGSNLSIYNPGGKGYVETNDISKLFPYMDGFNQEATVALGVFNKVIKNYGNLTIENSTLNNSVDNHGTLILKNTTINGVSNVGILELRNVTANGALYNSAYSSGVSVNPTLIISDDTQFGEGFIFYFNAGTVITNNTERFAEFAQKYTGNVVLTNKTISSHKTNYGNLTLNNCTINGYITNYQNLTLNNCTLNSTIMNNGRIIIDECTKFGDNIEISGSGEILINDISRILPYISIINGNHIISDETFTKTYTFYGTITLNNCTITSLDNVNYATLILNNCTVDVGADNTFLTNLQTLRVSNDTTINGKINDFTSGVDYGTGPKTYIITQDSIRYFIDQNGLNFIIKPGDILDIRGRILLNNSLLINKPVNIISSTKDGYIDLNTTAGDYFGSSQGNSFTINYAGAYTNVTGVYFHNTQLWIYSTHHVTFDNISVVVDYRRIGSGVGITSIREHSSYITVKNSYFHTTENEGSSTLVLALADYCTIENNTVEGDGFVGNLIYLTTYNVIKVPSGIYNSHNKIINNRLRGPEKPTSTCYGICISGFNNLVENNTIYSGGEGIMFQWGSGITGNETPGNESLVGKGSNIVRNNKLYGGCGINAGDLIYGNYMEGKLSVPEKSKAYNNTANRLSLESYAEATNNTILGKVTFNAGIKNSVVANNIIIGNIEIPATVSNIIISDNNISGSITLDGSFNEITNNKIITRDKYTVFSNKLGVNNTLTNNYLVASNTIGDDSVYLRDKSNILRNNPLATKIELITPTQVIVNKSIQLTIKLMDKNGNLINNAQVTVNSSAGFETVNITNGVGVYQYVPVAIGQDTVTVEYLGNASFYASTNSANINVVEEQKVIPPKEPVIKITGTNNAKVDYGFTYKVRITSDGKSVGAGKQVTLKIAGKTLTAKTDKNGYAIFTLAVAPKAYTATVTYNKVPQSYKITVKNVIVAKNAKVKKSAKKPTVKVTLKTSAKKPIAGKKLTIKINGKKVTAKTNKKGVATFNIKKIVKKLKAGKSYKYQVIYGKDTISKTLKVKK